MSDEILDELTQVLTELLRRVLREEEIEQISPNIVVYGLEDEENELDDDFNDGFNVDSKAPDKEMVIVVNYENQRMGIIIDNVEKQAQVVVKSIGKQFHQHDIISGASIMGNGQVALVLDTNKIINSIDKTKNSTKNIAL